jgi:hypothetical protein
MRDPQYVPRGKGLDERRPSAVRPVDAVRDRKAMTAAVRSRIFSFLRAWANGNDEAALEALGSTGARPGPDGDSFTPDRLRERREAHRAEHVALRLDPEARNIRHTVVKDDPAGGSGWRVEQMLVDVAGLNDWMAEFAVELDASGAAGEPVIALVGLGAVG